MAQTASPNDLLNGDISITLRRMTVPVIFGMMTMMTFNLVDSFFISLLGTQPLAAVSFTFPVTFSVISLSIGLSIGTSAVIARIMGEGKKDRAKLYATAALYLAAFLVMVLSVFGYLISRPLFSAMGASDAIYTIIMEYMTVWFAGSVLLILPMICNAIFRANGETKLPSYVMAGAGLVNAALDPLFIFGWGPVPEMGVRGAALASVVSWSLASVFIFYMLGVRQKRIYAVPNQWQLTKKAWIEIGRIGLPAAGANMLTPLAMGVMTAIVASYGEPVVAAFGVGSRIESIGCIAVLALSMTLPPLISQSFGAGRIERIEQAYRVCIRFTLIWQAVLAVVLALLSPYLASVFSDDPEVQKVLQLYICIMPLGYGLQGVVILANSSFNALHKPLNALILSVVRFFIFFVPFAYIGGLMFGVYGLLIGAVVGNVCTAVIAWRWFNKTVRGMAPAPLPS
ncbi:MATE family efflux transporter [Echinimonas agarilytica]|uniref:MATE family efflux transporter n=1 Tax=Echinimonas agarilytica TaxID=1215918 RepID=A0AA41W645_9GAMM|nr:MATE family efflux transporter [Echinimonas agarilytica]MCM2679475.1 MATE family efflux transporter [Echinimonas agarilytica]